MRKINVLVVDDSAFMRKVITDIIKLDDTLNVIGTAKNGKEAIEKIIELSPDIVTLDVEMPIMDGINALKIIMEKCPIPVLMLSSLTKEGTDATLKALELGAIDFVAKPTNVFKMNTDNMKKQLIEKIRIASQVNISSRNNNVIMAKRLHIQNKPVNFKLNHNIKKIVAIGTSTGGPRALQHVIPYIPKNIPASILIVQHMPEGFTKSLAERLNSLSEINVKEAEDGEILQPGYAYIAPGNHHLKIKKTDNAYKINLTKESPVSGHRPSVDVMLNSLAELKLNNLVGVIMTGMGSDGAEGMKNIKLQNAFTIAQNEETCVVYGMPRAAINLNCIDVVLPLQEIAPMITRVVGV